MKDKCDTDGTFHNRPVCGRCYTKKHAVAMELNIDEMKYVCPRCGYSFDVKDWIKE